MKILWKELPWVIVYIVLKFQKNNIHIVISQIGLNVFRCRRTLPWVNNRSEEKSYWEFTVRLFSSLIKTIRVDGPQKLCNMILYFPSLLTGDSAHFLMFIICDRMQFFKTWVRIMLDTSLEILLFSILSYIVVFFFIHLLLIFGCNEEHYKNHHFARIEKLLS